MIKKYVNMQEYNLLEKLIIKMEMIKLNKIIAKLNKKDRYIIDEFFWGEKTQAEIGKELGISQQALNKKLKKIIDKIGEKFNEKVQK